jgi:hypothetical protein
MINEIEMVEYSFTRDFVLMCSLGLNIGFFIGLLFI